jgi:hypothetical protein
MRKVLFLLAVLAILLPLRFVQAEKGATTTNISVKTSSTTATVRVWLCDGTSKGAFCTGMYECPIVVIPAHSSVTETCAPTYNPTAFEYAILTGDGVSCENLGQNPIGTTVTCSDSNGTVQLKVGH